MLAQEAAQRAAGHLDAALLQEVHVPGIGVVGSPGRVGAARAKAARLQVPSQLRALGAPVRGIPAVPAPRVEVALQELGRDRWPGPALALASLASTASFASTRSSLASTPGWPLQPPLGAASSSLAPAALGLAKLPVEQGDGGGRATPWGRAQPGGARVGP